MEEPYDPLREALITIFGHDETPKRWYQDLIRTSRLSNGLFLARRELQHVDVTYEIVRVLYQAMQRHTDGERLALEMQNLTQRTEDAKAILQLQAELEHLQAEEKKGELRRKIEAFTPRVQNCSLCGHPFNMEGDHVKIKVTKKRRKCTMGAKGLIGNAECVKRQEVERKAKAKEQRQQKKQAARSALVPAPSRNGHNALQR